MPAALATNCAAANASRASYQPRTICRQRSPDICGLPPWSNASRVTSSFPDTGVGVIVWVVTVNPPGVGSVPVTWSATRPLELLYFGTTNGVTSCSGPALIASKSGYWYSI